MLASLRQLRPSPALLLIAISALTATTVFGAARCPTKDPVGHGLLQFGGDEHARALTTDAALGINPLFIWAELEPSEGAFNWTPIDTALAAAHAAGRKVAPRVYTNAGDFSQATPGWVFDAGAAAYQIEAGASTYQPVPTDAVFDEKFGAFLRALGQRYNGNDDIEFFQTNAGMGAYGEMVWWLDEASRLPGYSAGAHIGTVQFWIDRWRDAFPDTHLALMQNYLGHGIAETVTAYAVERGFYLQSNSPGHEEAAAAILETHEAQTKIIIEIENRGCRTATGTAFDGVLAQVFTHGFAVDYLVVCAETFEDAEASQRAYDALRKPD